MTDPSAPNGPGDEKKIDSAVQACPLAPPPPPAPAQTAPVAAPADRRLRVVGVGPCG